MPEIEFLLKRKELIKKSAEQRSIDSIIDPDGIHNEEYKIYYTNVMVELEDMSPILEDDDEHTALFERGTGEVYVVKAKYRHVKYVKEFLSGRIVRNIDHFGIDEVILDKVDKVNQALNVL